METVITPVYVLRPRHAFNFLASLINGNRMGFPQSYSTLPTFNFLASLINGNRETQRMDFFAQTFNFLASLINGNTRLASLTFSLDALF